MNKKDICSYNYDELKEEMLAIGEKAFRSKQIYEFVNCFNIIMYNERNEETDSTDNRRYSR